MRTCERCQRDTPERRRRCRHCGRLLCSICGVIGECPECARVDHEHYKTAARARWRELGEYELAEAEYLEPTPVYVLTAEGERPSCIYGLDEFLAVNDDLVDWGALSALQPGESYTDGGGAAPVWTITRRA